MDTADYKLPEECELCGSSDLGIRVVYEKGITRYICQRCGYSRSISKTVNKAKRTGQIMNRWAAQVKLRYPYCVICGSKDDLEAHHIIPVSHSEEYKFWPTNGISLCRHCHGLVHKER